MKDDQKAAQSSAASEQKRNAFGGEETEFFHALTPERILDAVEDLGLKATGRCNALNSMENRVYEVEIEPQQTTGDRNRSDSFRIIKFYRPGRWNEQQILAEHNFLFELEALEIPVVAPLRFSDGSSLKQLSEIGIYSAVFPRCGGRSIAELDDLQLGMIGRLLARLHGVGAVSDADCRITLSPETYGDGSIDYLLSSESLPEDLESEYVDVVDEICDISEPWFKAAAQQRVHGDFHLGNILWRDDGLLVVDFDDMVMGPPVQDIWLVLPGRDAEAARQRDILLGAYEQMRPFDHSSLQLIEPLRALRIVHFDAWIAKRWSDPAFPKSFPHFGSDAYWREQIQQLSAQLDYIREL